MSVKTRGLQLVALMIAALVMSSCTVRHAIAKDYPKYLSNNAGVSNLPKTSKAQLYFLAPQTQTYSYEFRAFVTGAANLWVVDVGKILDDTMQSPDVQSAFGRLTKTTDQTAAQSDTLVFDLQSYTFENFGAHIALKISLTRAGVTAFEKIYIQDGKTQGGKMFFAGAFGQKNAVQQSTKLALDDILRQLISDLNSRP